MAVSQQLDLNNANWTAFRDKGVVAHGLPGEAYTSEAFFALEQEKLFPSTWVFVAFAHDLKQPGDVLPVTLGGQPLLLLRNRKGEIGAFHNACRHRCLKLVEEACNVGQVIRCPYHSWVYGLDGGLRSTPYFGGPEEQLPEGFDQKEHGLVPVRFAVWHDWIFVNLDGRAPEFDDYVAPLAARLEGIDFDKVRPVGSIEFEPIKTNWKFLMENFMEPYHVQFVHSSTTEQPLTDHATVVDDVCLGSLVDVNQEKGAEADGTLAVSSRYLTLFPIFIIGRYFPDQLGVYLNTPLGPGLTLQRRVIYSTGDVEMNEETVQGLKDLWYKVHKEDHEICERMQAGRASPVAADGGRLSPHWEDSVRRFQELIVEGIR